jgi:PBSX family phage terminase large subunit
MEFDPNIPPKQRETLKMSREGQTMIWEGSVRSGKTIISLVAWVDFITHAPPGPLLMVGRTLDTLRRNAVEPLIDLFGAKNIKPVYGNGTAKMFGRQVYLVGADNMSAESRIRGLTLAGAYVDEVSILGGPSGRDYWNMLLTRLSVKGAKLFGTTNPDSPRHWLLIDYLEKAEYTIERENTITHNDTLNKDEVIPGFYRFRFTLEDNPTLSEQYKNNLKAQLSGLWYKRFIDGEWVAAEGAIFPQLDATKHVVGKEYWDTVDHWIIAVDHGITNPTHALQIGLDNANERIVVGKECRIKDTTLTVGQQTQILTDWCLKDLNAHPADVTWVIDPAARSLRNEIWSTTGGNYAWPADNSVLPGISDMGTLLGTNPPSLVMIDTPELFTEMSGYTWNSDATERHGKDEPVKLNDHGVDALRYGTRYLRGYWMYWRLFQASDGEQMDRIFIR